MARRSSAQPPRCWVADNLAVVHRTLSTPAPLTTEAVLAWHRRLMRHDTMLEARVFIARGDEDPITAFERPAAGRNPREHW